MVTDTELREMLEDHEKLHDFFRDASTWEKVGFIEEMVSLRAEVERLTRANHASVARADTMMARADAALHELAERTRERDEAMELVRVLAHGGSGYAPAREFLARVKP